MTTNVAYFPVANDLPFRTAGIGEYFVRPILGKKHPQQTNLGLLKSTIERRGSVKISAATLAEKEYLIDYYMRLYK